MMRNSFLLLLFLCLFVVGCASQNPIILISERGNYIFSHTNETISVLGANTWTNVTFLQEVADINRGIGHNHNNGTSQEYTILFDGIYSITYNFDLQDTSVSASDIHVGARVIFINGSELPGSVFETDIIKQEVEMELSHEFLEEFIEGDIIVFQFIADDSDIEISTHGTFGDNPESASISISKISN